MAPSALPPGSATVENRENKKSVASNKDLKWEPQAF